MIIYIQSPSQAVSKETLGAIMSSLRITIVMKVGKCGLFPEAVSGGRDGIGGCDGIGEPDAGSQRWVRRCGGAACPVRRSLRAAGRPLPLCSPSCREPLNFMPL